MKSHSKWNVTQNRMSLKIECHLKLNITQNWNITQNEMQSKWNNTSN